MTESETSWKGGFNRPWLYHSFWRFEKLHTFFNDAIVVTAYLWKEERPCVVLFIPFTRSLVKLRLTASFEKNNDPNSVFKSNWEESLLRSPHSWHRPEVKDRWIVDSGNLRAVKTVRLRFVSNPSSCLKVGVRKERLQIKNPACWVPHVQS